VSRARRAASREKIVNAGREPGGAQYPPPMSFLRRGMDRSLMELVAGE
jgi:hypothetical protein